MDIREANISDISIIAEVIKESYITVADRYGLTLENCPKHPSNCSIEWVENDIAKGVMYFVFESNNKIYGCIAAEKATKETCYLERLAVVPVKRNQGVGLRLFEHFLHEVASQGFKKIGIGIIAKQQDLKAWYKKIGFFETGRRSFDHLPFEVAFMEYHIKIK